MSKTITKVKFQKEGGVEIHFDEVVGKTTKEVKFKCSELQSPDFDVAMSALVRDAYKILELPADYAPQRMKITGVSFSTSEETGVEGAVITGQVELHTSNSPFCFNTPYLPFEQHTDDGTAPLMPEEAQRNLEVLKDEALKYVEQGKRAQLDLLHAEA